MQLIDGLNWRYATKKFDPSRKLADTDLQQVLEAVRLSASSYGLQLYKVLVIENPELRQQLRPASWGQSQITDASQVIVFCNYTRVTPQHIDAYLAQKASTQGVALEALQGYGEFMKSTIGAFPAEAVGVWTAKQCYIALGNLLAACGELQIDACPMEGFDAVQYNQILGLDAQGLNAAVVATIGYRAADDATQHQTKVRKPASELFEWRR